MEQNWDRPLLYEGLTSIPRLRKKKKQLNKEHFIDQLATANTTQLMVCGFRAIDPHSSLEPPEGS